MVNYLRVRHLNRSVHLSKVATSMADIGEEPNRSLKYFTLSHYLRFQRYNPAPKAEKVAGDYSKKETALFSVVKWVCNLHDVSESLRVHFSKCIAFLGRQMANVMHREKFRAMSPLEREPLSRQKIALMR